MKKKFFYIIGIIICLLLFSAYLLFNPPLATISSTFHGADNKIIMIPIGNDGIAKIKNLEVVINDKKKPNEAKIQIIEHPEGAFSLSFDTQENNVFKELEGFKLPTGTNIEKRLESDSTTLAYGLTVESDVPISNLTIKYRYLGIQYSEILHME